MTTSKASARGSRSAPRRRSALSSAGRDRATADQDVARPDPAPTPSPGPQEDPGDVPERVDPGEDDLAGLNPDDVFAEFVDEIPDTGEAARAEYLPRRGYLVLRQVYVQHRQNPEQPVERPSTLGKMVGRREFRAILLYLLVLAAEPLLASNRRLPLRTIANMLATTTSPCTVRQARQAITALVKHDLVRVAEHGMTVELFPLLEDGSGTDWTPPTGEDDDPDLRNYMTVPHELFTDRMLDQLTLPGLAVLLVALKETSATAVFSVPVDRFPQWYGFSERTAERGYRELDQAGLVRVHRQLVRDSRMPRGVRAQYHRTLLGAFSTQSRRDAQARARAARRGAAAATASTS